MNTVTSQHAFYCTCNTISVYRRESIGREYESYEWECEQMVRSRICQTAKSTNIKSHRKESPFIITNSRKPFGRRQGGRSAKLSIFFVSCVGPVCVKLKCVLANRSPDGFVLFRPRVCATQKLMLWIYAILRRTRKSKKCSVNATCTLLNSLVVGCDFNGWIIGVNMWIPANNKYGVGE